MNYLISKRITVILLSLASFSFAIVLASCDSGILTPEPTSTPDLFYESIMRTARANATEAARLSTQSREQLSAFTGDWQGSIAGEVFQLQIRVVSGKPQATWRRNGNIENLQMLGYDADSETLYLFRKADSACICVYNEDGELNHYRLKPVGFFGD